MKNEKILLFSVNIMKAGQIQALCQKLGITVITVPSANRSQPLGVLAGISGNSNSAGQKSFANKQKNKPFGIGQQNKPFVIEQQNKSFGIGQQNKSILGEKEMLLFCGITSQRMDVFLEEYKKMSIPPIALKAIITPYNIGWNADQLQAELEKEHARL